jgi:arginyl-tRNA synthetase
VRSNGVVTYVGKDIAYQFWKLGLLGRDFHYRTFVDRPGGRCGPRAARRARRASAVRRRVVRLQRHRRPPVVPAEAAEAGAHRRRAIRKAPSGRTTFSYEMVALSHETARELGHAPAPDSEDARKPFVEVSGRKGLGVKADDLIDTLIKKATEEVAKRNPEFTAPTPRAWPACWRWPRCATSW